MHELQVHQIELEMQNEELQQTRTEVEAGLQQFTELYDFAPVGYITLASDGMIKQVNLRGASLIGTERSRLVGSNFNLFVASADLPVLNTFLKNVFNSGSKESCELNLCKRDSQRITPDLFDHRSNPETFLCVVRIEAELADDRQTCRAILIDISEHKQMEDRIRYLSSFPQSNPNPVIEIGRDRQIIYMNPAASAILTQLDQRDGQAFVPADFDRLIKNIERVSGTQFYTEVKIGEHIFGETIHVAPQVDALRLYINDITVRKRAEEEISRLNAELELRVDERTHELLSSNAQLSDEINRRIKVQDKLTEEHNLISTILNNANALIVVLDQEGRIITFNQFCETLTGLKSRDVKGKYLFDLNLIPPDELTPLQEFYDEFKNNSNATKFYYENSWIGQDTRNHLIGWSAAAINGINSKMEFMVFLGLDLTENRNLRESLRTSEEKYRELFLNLPISTLEVAFENGKLLVVDANYQALQTYGKLIDLASKSFIGKIFAPDRKKDIETIIKQSNHMTRLAFESNHIRSNGETFPVRINISFELDLPSSHFILVIEDITSEKNRRSQEIAISDERARMAREIHDGIAQDLASLKMRSYSWKDLIVQAPQALNAEIDFLQKLVDNEIQEVRRSIFALRPLSLEKESFLRSITTYVKDFGELNRISSHLLIRDGMPNLAEELELGMFRMIQESLNNVAKYSKAKNVWVDFKINPDKSITFEIRDDGIGFNIEDLKQMPHHGHFGLSQMQERVREHQGKFEIASAENTGVTIRIILPIREKMV